MLTPFHFVFVQRGLLEIALLSIGAGLLGPWLVLRGLAFYTHAVGTAAFPGLVLADGLGFSPPLGAALGAAGFAGGVGLLGRSRRADYATEPALALGGARSARGSARQRAARRSGRDRSALDSPDPAVAARDDRARRRGRRRRPLAVCRAERASRCRDCPPRRRRFRACRAWATLLLASYARACVRGRRRRARFARLRGGERRPSWDGGRCRDDDANRGLGSRRRRPGRLGAPDPAAEHRSARVR